MYVCMYVYVCTHLRSAVSAARDGLHSEPQGCSSEEPFLRSTGYEPTIVRISMYEVHHINKT